jgi:hypothetical protein
MTARADHRRAGGERGLGRRRQASARGCGQEGLEKVHHRQVLQLQDSGSFCPGLPQAQEGGRHGGHCRCRGGANSAVKARRRQRWV